MSARRTRAFVDAIESGVARLLVGDAVVKLPARLLPDGALEGAWLELDVSLVDPPPPGDDDTEARRRKLADGDDGSDFKL